MVLADALQMHLEDEDYLTCAALQLCIEKIDKGELIVPKIDG